MKWTAICLGVVAYGPTAFSQITNCSTPAPIQGEGAHTFDSNNFPTTTFGQGTACNWQGASRSHEIYYQWTPLADGDYTISLASASYTAGLAAYIGDDCSAICLGSAAETSPEEVIQWTLEGVLAGDVYLIHCVSLSGQSGMGTLEITRDPCSPAAGLEDALEPNDSCSQAWPIGPGRLDHLWMGTQNPDLFSVLVPVGFGLSLEDPSGIGAVAFEVLDEDCQLLEIVYGGLGPVNAGLQPETWKIRPVLFGGVEPACTQYSLDLQLYYVDCLPGSVDVLDGQLGPGSNQFVNNGYFSDLSLHQNPWDGYYFCVPPGRVLSLEIDVLSPVGAAQATLTDQSWPCQSLGDVAFETGRNIDIQWANPGNCDSSLLLVLRPEAGSPPCLRYEMRVDGTGGCGSVLESNPFCAPGTANSSGQSTVLMATQEWTLNYQIKWEANQGPAGHFGYLLVGEMVVDPGVMVGSGSLCLSPSLGLLGRYNASTGPRASLGQFDFEGRWVNLSNTSDSAFGYLQPDSTPWGTTITSGQTLGFQLWHRDVGGTSNLSNGLALRF